MAVRKYYEIPRRERQKYRKKLMRLLQNRDYTEEEQLRIIDSVAGRTALGKEHAAKELTEMITDGAEKEEILSFIKTYGEAKFPFSVR